WLGRDVRDHAQPAAHWPAARRAHTVCAAAAVAPARGPRLLARGHRARQFVVRLVHLGRARAPPVARSPRASPGARHAPSPAAVARAGMVDGGGAVCGDVRAGAADVAWLKEVGEGREVVEAGGGWLGAEQPPPASTNLQNLPNLRRSSIA